MHGLVPFGPRWPLTEKMLARAEGERELFLAWIETLVVSPAQTAVLQTLVGMAEARELVDGRCAVSSYPAEVVRRALIHEGTLADYLNRLLADFPLLQLGSYPEFSNPEYKVKVTLESRDRGYVEQALTEFLTRLPDGAVVKVT